MKCVFIQKKHATKELAIHARYTEGVMINQIFKFIKSIYIDNLKAFMFYATRWQISTPVFLIINIILAQQPYWQVIVIGNIVGATIFFPIDQWILKRK